MSKKSQSESLQKPTESPVVGKKIGPYSAEFVESQVDRFFEEGIEALTPAVMRQDLFMYVMASAVLRINKTLEQVL